ncbi:hypothetical protein TNCV_4751401 [Trichonephila clavipes]|nr:hypothetical protein TNCV_4751401 [Trichonephila clavipes]
MRQTSCAVITLAIPVALKPTKFPCSSHVFHIGSPWTRFGDCQLRFDVQTNLPFSVYHYVSRKIAVCRSCHHRRRWGIKCDTCPLKQVSSEKNLHDFLGGSMD